MDINILEQLKLVTGEESSEVLSAYYTIATHAVLNRVYPFSDDPTALPLPNKYKSITFEIAVYLLNKRGAEGQTHHTENGITRTYESADIPPSLINRIIPQVGVVN